MECLESLRLKMPMVAWGEEGRRRALLASKRTDEMGVEKVEVRDRNKG